MTPHNAVSLSELLRQTREACARVVRARELAFVTTIFTLIVLERVAIAVNPALSMLGLFALVPLAILSHVEALGAAEGRRDLFGRWGSQIWRYCLDAAALSLVMLAASISALLILRPPATAGGTIETLLVMGLLGPLVTARLCLKLPARALRDPRSWSAHFVLTRNATLLLASGLWAILVPFALTTMLLSVVLGEFWILKSILMNGLSALVVVALACYTSVSYRALVQHRSEPLRALPAPAP